MLTSLDNLLGFLVNLDTNFTLKSAVDKNGMILVMIKVKFCEIVLG